MYQYVNKLNRTKHLGTIFYTAMFRIKYSFRLRCHSRSNVAMVIINSVTSLKSLTPLAYWNNPIALNHEIYYIQARLIVLGFDPLVAVSCL